MIQSIQLTNFKQHRALTVNLTPGLNVIRGANEAGKSSVLEAIGYAFYGSNFLAQSLAETVTWGETENTLRVEVRFSFDGVDGVVKRGKSGAELLYGATQVSGQAEVSRYFERLFGTNLAMANNLQIAGQNKVRGTVEGGGAAAVSLIEALGDFSLLEQLVDRIVQHRPNGNTASTVDRVQRLTDAAAGEVPPEPSAAPVEAAQQALEVAQQAEAVAAGAVAAAGPARADAEALLRGAQRVASEVRTAQARLEQIDTELAKPCPSLAGTAADIEKWQAAAEAEKQRETLLVAYKVVPPTCPYEWDESRDAMLAAKALAQENLDTHNRRLQQLQLDKTQHLALVINEDTCSFCKKSLADVPEVARRNAELDMKVQAINTEMAAVAKARDAEAANLAAYKAIEQQDIKVSQLFPQVYWEWDMAAIPRRCAWKGEVPKADRDYTDYRSLIRVAQTAQTAADRWAGTQDQLKAEQARLLPVAQQVAPDTEAAEATLEGFRLLETAHTQAKVEAQRLMGELRVAEANLQAARAARATAVQGLESAKREVEKAKQELADMAFFNELIKKIRGARPVVANKLWALVLHTVSNYTAHGRGVPSTVTRTESGFQINGKGIKAYSGSAQDVLGMAVRLALVKTFLPSTPFMVMDEIAAACDDDRELSLLGMVMAADIPQTILVTHSDAAESFAANLVQI